MSVPDVQIPKVPLVGSWLADLVRHRGGHAPGLCPAQVSAARGVEPGQPPAFLPGLLPTIWIYHRKRRLAPMILAHYPTDILAAFTTVRFS